MHVVLDCDVEIGLRQKLQQVRAIQIMEYLQPVGYVSFILIHAIRQ
jgi:hypothetical protein